MVIDDGVEAGRPNIDIGGGSRVFLGDAFLAAAASATEDDNDDDDDGFIFPNGIKRGITIVLSCALTSAAAADSTSL